MKLAHISDSHGFHNHIVLEDNIDIICHTGDIANNRNLAINSNEVINFIDWYSSLNIKYKLLICGNHDLSVYHKYITKKDFESNGIIYLENESITIEGYKIYGTPITPTFNDWAWNVARHKTIKYWNMIDDDSDIVLCHGPCRYLLDETICFETGKNIHVGCKSLLNRILDIQPTLFLHGHLHNNKNCYNYGSYFNGKTIFSNASTLNHHNEIMNKPLYYVI